MPDRAPTRSRVRTDEELKAVWRAAGQTSDREVALPHRPAQGPECRPSSDFRSSARRDARLSPVPPPEEARSAMSLAARASPINAITVAPMLTRHCGLVRSCQAAHRRLFSSHIAQHVETEQSDREETE